MGYVAGVDYNSEPCSGGFDRSKDRFTARRAAPTVTTLLDVIINGVEVTDSLAGGIETAFRGRVGYLTAASVAERLVKVSHDLTQADLGNGWEPLDRDFVQKVKALCEEGLSVVQQLEKLDLQVLDESGNDAVQIWAMESLTQWHTLLINADLDQKSVEEELAMDPFARMLAAGFKKGR